MKDPPARDSAKSHPLILSDGIEEKKAPIVQPMASPAPYPMMIPPPKDWAYLIGLLGNLSLNSPANRAAAKAPGNTPTLTAKGWVKIPELPDIPVHPGISLSPAASGGGKLIASIVTLAK